MQDLWVRLRLDLGRLYCRVVVLRKLTNSPCYALVGGPYLPRWWLKKLTLYPLAPHPTLPILARVSKVRISQIAHSCIYTYYIVDLHSTSRAGLPTQESHCGCPASSGHARGLPMSPPTGVVAAPMSSVGSRFPTPAISVSPSVS